MRLFWLTLAGILMSISASAAGQAIAIAPRAEALTFARAGEGETRRLLLVSRYEGGTLSGIDVTSALAARPVDPIAAYTAHGYEALAALTGSEVEVLVSDLTIPVDLTASHIAVGTNFPAHAEESTVEDGPFLFPKEVVPTSATAPIPAGDGLLDYEVELCFVALEDFPVGTPPERAGLILCNDVTDRAKLMRHLDVSDVTSGKGFTTGKSAPGYMPVGNLFVIPKDLRGFAANVDLKLYRGSDLAQSARQSLAIWDFDEILAQSAARAGTRWANQGREVGLPISDATVPARTAILGGTPDGTIFKGVDRSVMARGALDWLLGGWNRPLTHWVIERYIAREKAARTYLQPGETVTIRVEKMGELRNMVSTD